jgi:hypothetical protein
MKDVPSDDGDRDQEHDANLIDNLINIEVIPKLYIFLSVPFVSKTVGLCSPTCSNLSCAPSESYAAPRKISPTSLLHMLFSL